MSNISNNNNANISLDYIINSLYDNYTTGREKGGVFQSESKSIFGRLINRVYYDCSLEVQVKFIVLCFSSSVFNNLIIEELKIIETKKQDTEFLRYFKLMLNKFPNLKKLFSSTFMKDEAIFDLDDSGMAVLDADKRWSPISSAGKIYEFDRGVIGINQSGQIIKKPLDSTYTHHDTATWSIINNKELHYLGHNYDNSDYFRLLRESRSKNPFEIGCEASDEKGFIILQLEGDGITAYVPKNINLKQLLSLMAVLAPRKKFEISFWNDGEIHENTEVIDYIDVEYFEKYCVNLFSGRVNKKFSTK